jgi:hypothetical protein
MFESVTIFSLFLNFYTSILFDRSPHFYSRVSLVFHFDYICMYLQASYKYTHTYMHSRIPNTILFTIYIYILHETA